MTKHKRRQKVTNLTVKLVLGLATLIVGLICAGVVMFQVTDAVDAQSISGGLNRYVLGLTSFIAIVSGTMLLNDAWVLRGVLKGRYEFPTEDSIMKAYQALYSLYIYKAKNRDEAEEDEEEKERVKVQASH